MEFVKTKSKTDTLENIKNWIRHIWHFSQTGMALYLEKWMYIRLRRYGLYGILRLRNVGAVDIDVRGGDIIPRIAFAIRCRTSIGLLRFCCLQAACT